MQPKKDMLDITDVKIIDIFRSVSDSSDCYFIRCQYTLDNYYSDVRDAQIFKDSKGEYITFCYSSHGGDYRYKQRVYLKDIGSVWQNLFQNDF